MRYLTVTLPLLFALTACANTPPDGSNPAATTTAAPPPSATTLSMTGIGPVQLGMTVPEAEQALRVRLNPMTAGEEAACWMTRRADGRDQAVFYMVENGRITRIDIDNRSGTAAPAATTAIKTAEGIAIGAAEPDVLAAYGPSTKVMPHKYDEHGHYLVVDSADARAALVFETSDGKVTTFRTGFHPAVDYVEGCS